MKKLIGFFSILLILFSCQSLRENDGKELKISCHQSEVPSYHPFLSQDCLSLTLGKALFEGLTRIDLQGKPSFALANDIQISPCKKVYTIYLRPSFWSNGEKLTAFHFASAWKRALLPESKAYKAQNLFVIKNAKKIYKKELPLEDLGIHVENERKLTVELEYPAPYFLQLLADPIFSPLYDESQVPSVFNGPFILDKETNSSQIVLRANSKYWDSSSVKLNKIKIFLIKNEDTAFLMYENKELDLIGAPLSVIPQQLIDSIKLKGLINQPICSPYWLFCNTKKGLLRSQKIRKALAYTVDRERVSSHVLKGQLPNKSVLPKEISHLQSNELYKDKNNLFAKKLFQEGLEELCIKKEDAVITFSHSDIPIQEKLAEYLQSHWKNIFGISIKLQKSDWNTFLQNLRNQNQEIGGAYAICTFKDPICFLERFEYVNDLRNPTGWESKRYQSYLEKARETIDEKERASLLKKAEILFLEEMPAIPIYNFTYQYLKRNTLKGICLPDLGYVDFKWVHWDREG